jgi:hypothetical protein
VNKKKTEHCQHPKNEQYLDGFICRYHKIRRDAKFAIIDIDPTEYWVSDDPKKNTLKRCQMCSVSKDIARTSYRNMSTNSTLEI